VPAVARRLTGLVIAFALVAGLPVAAARASCVCDHGHSHDTASAAARQAPAAVECPMHHHAGAATHAKADPPAGGDSMRCGCAGQAQALFGRASFAGVVPTVVRVDAPVVARRSRVIVAEAVVSLADTPPAPPPRA
jgi:hypothetical protein